MSRAELFVKSVEVTDDAAAANAVKNGQLPGAVYPDGEVWAEEQALKEWRRTTGSEPKQHEEAV
jgi:hypothetical protein